MASDILITPNKGSAVSNAKIEFVGATSESSTMRIEVLPNGALSFIGSGGTAGIGIDGSITTTIGSAISYAAAETYLIWSDEPEYSVVDDATDANYKTVKTFVASKSGTFKFKFSAYIQSGTYYWAWRVLKNGSTVVASGHYNSGLDTGEVTSVHAYRRFVGTVSSIQAGDSFALQMVSSTGGGSPVAGNGQLLYAKEFRVYSSMPSVEHGGLSNVWGANVGIGTSSPTEKLQVNGTLRIQGTTWNEQGTLALGNAANGAGYYDTGLFRGGIGTLTQGNYVNVAGYAGIAFNTSAAAFGSQANRMFIDGSNGNVGIGNTSPTAKLQVGAEAHGNATGIEVAAGAGGANLLALTNSTNHNWFPYTDGSNYYSAVSHTFRNETHATNWMVINSSGNVGIGTTSPTGTYGKLSVAGGISILNDNNAKLEIGRYSSGASNSYIKLGANSNSLRITNNVDGADIFVIENAGNVGIGTTSPGAKLDVAGDFRAYQIPEYSKSVKYLSFSQADYKHKYVLLAKVPTFGNSSYNVGISGKLTAERVNMLSMSVDQNIYLRIGYGNQVVYGQSDYGQNYFQLVKYTHNAVDYLALYAYTAPNWEKGVFDGIVNNRGGWLDSNFLLVVELDSANHSAASYGASGASFSTGNVGIGTTGPTTALDVYTAANTGGLKVRAGDSGAGATIADFQSSAGASKVFIRGDGNVGIGTTSPGAKLEVRGGGNIVKVFNSVGESNNSTVLIQNDYGTGSSVVDLTASANRMTVGAEGQSIGDYGGIINVVSNRALKFATNNNERMRITNTGNVGIGTTASDLNGITQKLTIGMSGTTGSGIGIYSLQNVAQQYIPIGVQYSSGNTNNGAQIRFGIDAAGDTKSMIAFAVANGSTPVEQVRITSTGNVGIGVSNPLTNLQIGKATVTFPTLGTASGNLSLTNNSTALWGMYVGLDGSGSGWIQQMRNDSAIAYNLALNPLGGNVGIGTTSPSQKLEVGNFLDAFTNRITVSARYEYLPEFNFRLGQSGTGYDWIGGVISCGDDSNYNGVMYFKTANASRDTPTTKMVIKASGNVGIGATSPDAMLHAVGGTAMSGGWNRTMTLEATYPSLVFKSNSSKWAAIQYDFSSALNFRVGATSNDVNASGVNALSIAAVTGAATFASTVTASGFVGNLTGNAATASNLAADTSTRFKIITFTGVGGDSGNGAQPDSYAIYQQGGSWTHPYPDLCIGYHTGIKIGASYGYGGTRFYNNSDWATEIFSVGNGDNNVRVINTIYAAAFSGPLTGNVTGNVTGNAATATSLTTAYVSGQQLNPQTYFSMGTGLKVAMTAVAGYWSDTVWINGYSGGDVKQMCALHTQRNGTPRMYISNQASDATSYGPLYEFLTAYNYTSYSPSLTGSGASGSWNINAATVTNGVYVGATNTLTAPNYFQSNLGATSGALSGPPLQAYSTGNNSAFMSFHKSANYAVNFGLDSDNVLRIGGWSASANRWQLDMSGNNTIAGNFVASGTGASTFAGSMGIGDLNPSARGLSLTTASDVGMQVTMTRATGTNYGWLGGPSGAATTNIGMQPSASGATNNYSIRIPGPSVGANNYAIYADSAAQSFFGGNIGVGTTTPKGMLDLNFGNTSPVGLTDVSIGALRMSGNGGLTAISSRQFDSANQPAGGDIQFLNLYYNGSTYNWYETMRIRANGSVGIGTASPSQKLDVSSTTASGQNIAITKLNSGTGDQNSGNLYFDNYGPAALARNSGTELGSIYFRSSQPSSAAIQNSARIQAIADGTQTGLYTQGALTFAVVANGGVSLVEAMRINSGGTIQTAGSFLIGGNFANNSYISVASTKLLFGGGNDPNSYYLGTNLNNYGGNYTKLDLAWHTGIRLGARATYGGVRFFSDETLGTQIFSVGETDGNVRVTNNLYSPIYYDANNTAYYVDPASTSNLSITQTTDFRALGQVRATGWYGVNSTSHTGPAIEIGVSNPDSTNGYILAYNRNTNSYLNMNFNATAFNFAGQSAGYLTCDTSVRTPIFYDSNDTAYYVNPNSNSNLSSASFAGTVTVNAAFINTPEAGVDSYLGYGANRDIFLTTKVAGIHYFRDATGTVRASFTSTVANFAGNVGIGTTSPVANLDVRRTAGDGSGPVAWFSTLNSNSGYFPQDVAPILTLERRAYRADGNAGVVANGGLSLDFRLTDQQVMTSPAVLGGQIVVQNTYGQNSNAQPRMVFRTGNAGTMADSLTVASSGNVGIGTVSPNHKLHLASGFIATSFGFNYTPSSWARGYGGVIMAGSANSDGTGWSYGGRIVEVDEGDGMNMAFDVNYTNSWTNNAMVISGRSGKQGNVGIGTTSPSQKLDVQGTAYASSDFRAPIFYDSNDTGYYIDPNSTSNTALRMRGGAYFGPNTTWGAYLYVGTNGNVSGTATVAATNGNLHLDSAGSSYPIYLQNYTGGYTLAYGSIRSPIFYDLDNTGYYTDPASTSNLNALTVNSTFTVNYGWSYVANNYGYGIVGLYNPNVYQLVFAMGDAYKTTAGGGISNLYGIAWSHPNAGGIAANLNTHGALVTENGAFLAAISGSIRCRDDMRAPIFYDSNNTTYYVDPNSNSNFAGSISVSQNNVTGGGIILADDGDIVDLNDGYCAMRFSNGVRIHAGNRTGGAVIRLGNDGAIVASSNITAYGSASDLRLKENVIRIDDALGKVMQMNGYYFNYIGKTDRMVGVIAQEIEPVLKEVVYEYENMETEEKNKAVYYGNITAVLIEAIKAQQVQIEELKAQIIIIQQTSKQ